MSNAIQIASPLGEIPHGWRLDYLKNLVFKIGSGATPRGGESNYIPRRDNFALVRSQNVFDRYFDKTGLAYISDEQASQLLGVQLRPNDVLLNITGDGITFARVCIVPEYILPACVNQHVSIIRTDPNVCLPGYLLAYLTHPTIKLYIESFNAGGSRRAITKGHIESFVVPLPPLAEQREIALILGSFDDKIELNRRTNATLEATARALFQSWFVDFDPVRAKAEGRQPEGMDAETAALFPDAFEESELGLIPRGWRVGTFGDIAEFNTWTLSKRDELDVIEYIEISEVQRGEIGEIKTYIRGEEPSRARRRLRHGDTVISTVRPDRGSYFLCLDPSLSLIASTGFAVFTPLTAQWSFVHCALTRHDIFERLGSLADGAAYPAVAPETIAKLPLVIPPDELVEVFHTVCGAMYETAANNRRSSRTLAETRDALLPKLISGEVRVGDLNGYP